MDKNKTRQNEAYKQRIIQIINSVNDNHILQCIYTVAETHLMIAGRKGGAV